MKRNRKSVSRRSFLKTMGAAGIGSIVSSKVFAEPNEPSGKKQQNQPLELPRRKLGKTGVEISCLVMGLSFNTVENQLILRKAIDWGVTSWDTSHFYANGNSEIGIGQFLEKNPEARKKLFLITKASSSKNVEQVEEKLQTSLKRMKTGYIDLYYGVHGLSNPTKLNDELKRWAEKAKERNLIKFFGFSTHSNTVDCLMAASKLDWIDAVMTTYNFRLTKDQKLLDAVKACHDAGIGVIAMKTQGQRVEPDQGDEKLTERFRKRGFTQGQAKIKFVLENENITAACVGGDNIQHLRQNVAAVLDKTELSRLDKETLENYASQTCTGYCAGCSNICASAVPEVPCVANIMRYLMYYNSYGEKQNARQLFALIPQQTRSKLLAADYTAAESLCPQGLPIARLMAQAVTKLA